MATASTIVRDPGNRARELARSASPLLAALVILLAVVAVRAQGTVGADVSWQLWIAHQLNGGVRLYRDIVEANPPLWFWMAMPVDWFAGLVHIRSDHVLIALVGFFAALSLAATDRILEPIGRRGRTFLLVYAALVLTAMPWAQFGQREQIALIGTLPYAALVGARRTGRTLPAHFAFLTGAGAALGFALKHYFLLVPISLELWLLVDLGRKWRPLRAETIAVAAVGLAYGAAFVLFAGDYLSLELPLLSLAYGVTGAERIVDLFQPAVLTGLATLALLTAHLRAPRSERSGFAAAMAIASMGFVAAYFIQAKGWSYHAIPFEGCAALSLGAVLTCESKPLPVMLAAPALLFLPFWIAATQIVEEPSYAADVEQGVEGLHAGDSVGYLASDPALGWTETFQRGFRYPSRYYGFWMMRAVVKNERSFDPDPRLTRLGSSVVAETVQDFRCLPPRRILVARPTPAAAKAGEFDILPFFLRDPHFRDLLSHYRPIDRSNSLEVFAQVSSIGGERDCIRRARD